MDNELLEILAERSHIGWARKKQENGFADHPWRWIPGSGAHAECRPACSLSAEQHHPDMVPYADLDEQTKDYDRETVRGVLDGIREAGYVVMKADAVTVSDQIADHSFVLGLSRFCEYANCDRPRSEHSA